MNRGTSVGTDVGNGGTQIGGSFWTRLEVISVVVNQARTGTPRPERRCPGPLRKVPAHRLTAQPRAADTSGRMG